MGKYEPPFYHISPFTSIKPFLSQPHKSPHTPPPPTGINGGRRNIWRLAGDTPIKAKSIRKIHQYLLHLPLRYRFHCLHHRPDPLSSIAVKNLHYGSSPTPPMDATLIAELTWENPNGEVLDEPDSL